MVQLKTYPDDCIQFLYGDLLGALNSRCYLLLMLQPDNSYNVNLRHNRHTSSKHIIYNRRQIQSIYQHFAVKSFTASALQNRWVCVCVLCFTVFLYKPRDLRPLCADRKLERTSKTYNMHQEWN